MFAVVHGAWPRIAGEDAARAAARVVGIQETAGIDLVTDGQVRWPDLGEATLAGIVDGSRPLLVAWRAAAALTGRAVAQAVPGPYSLARRGDDGAADTTGRRERTLALADALAGEVRALAEAGCPVIMVEEPRAVDIGDDPAERALFTEAQRRLLAPAPDLHAMLVIAGGSANAAGAATFVDAPYRSFLFDLIAGADNWYLAREVPGDRGVVCGALPSVEPRTDPGAPMPEDPAPLLVWAAGYAASMAGRGPARVGLANAGPLRALTPETAAALVAELGRAARLAAMTRGDAVAAGLDPRTFNRPATRPAGRPRRRT